MLKTDYSNISDLYLTYPLHFDKEYHSLLPFFEALIVLIPNEIRLFLIVNNQRAGERLKNIFPNKNIEIVLIKGFYEPWLRDIMGFNSNQYIFKPTYQPTYYRDIYTKSYLSKLDCQVRQIIAKTIDKEIIDIPLVWDCGNLVTNGEIGFITDKIFRDNKNKSELEIRSMIEKNLKIEPIIIPSPPNDHLSHSDGYLAFLDDRSIAYPTYSGPGAYNSDVNYSNWLEFIIKYKGLTPVNILDNPSIDLSRDHIDNLYSAKGNYVNFIRLNGTIIFPQYTYSGNNYPLDFNHVNNDIINFFTRDLRLINSDGIAKQGGVLRCLTFLN